jgi:hypothetical protein
MQVWVDMKLRLTALTDPLVLVATILVLLFFTHLTGLWLGQSVLFNQTGPVVLGAVCIWAGYVTVRNEPQSLWSPLPWFLVACAMYFGLGPLIYHFGSEESITYIDNFYTVNERDLARTNMLNAFSMALVISGYILGKKLFQQAKFGKMRQFSLSITRRLTYIFLAIGITVELLFYLPYRLGLLSWTLPGAIQYLSTFSKIAIILLFLLVGRGFSRFRLLLYGLITFELVLALMSFSKLEVINVFIAIALGWYLLRQNLRGLILGSVAVALLYVFVLSPFVTFGRIAYSNLGVGSVSQITSAVEEFGSTEKDDLAGILPGVQSWWTRFCYTNAQAFAMNDHDQGAGGETMQLALYAFVPRLLFPDKPLMTPGRDFTAAVTGYDTDTHTAPGFFAEAYWNGGWMLVIVACLYVGVVFAGFDRFVKRTIGLGKYEFLPIVLIGITLGYSPDSWFAATFVGSLAQALGLYVILRALIILFFRDIRISVFSEENVKITEKNSPVR